MAALAGTNVIYGLGMIDAGTTFDYGQLVLDDEFARMIKQAVAGVTVSRDTLAVDVIAELAPFKDFLSHAHTLAHVRAQSQPRLMDRRVREEWEADGSRDAYERAWAVARELLATHHPDPLPENVCTEMRGIVDELDEALAQR